MMLPRREGMFFGDTEHGVYGKAVSDIRGAGSIDGQRCGYAGISRLPGAKVIFLGAACLGSGENAKLREQVNGLVG